MNFKNTFCSSPWFHMRITSDGSFNLCRWGRSDNEFHENVANIKTTPPEVWFQEKVNEFRKEIINGNGHETNVCFECYKMEKHGKISGRQRQLLKSGIIDGDEFEKTLVSSPWIDEFKKTLKKEKNLLYPQDWQIDIGNYCNSGCVMCHPMSSSVLDSEFKKIGIINNKQPKAWTRDPAALKNFFNCIDKTPSIAYMHFIGGEPVINPAFKQILQKLIDNGLNDTATIGFTTNLTVWDDDLNEKLKRFGNLNLGLSIECLDPLNDYIRYGSNVDETKHLLDKWCKLADECGWSVQLRITPTLLSIEKLHTIYEYAWENNLSVESCNFLEDPDYLRPSVLPLEYRQESINNLSRWIEQNSMDVDTSDKKVINARHPDHTKNALLQDAKSYIDYLKNSEDESHLLGDLVQYLNKIEKSRNNCILNYIPHYEPLLRPFGYHKIH